MELTWIHCMADSRMRPTTDTQFDCVKVRLFTKNYRLIDIAPIIEKIEKAATSI